VIYNEKGLDFNKLEEVKKRTGSVINYKPGKVLPIHDIIKMDVDILIPAAIPDLIKHTDVKNVKAKIIVEGSNIPIEYDVEELLHMHGVTIVPDLVANAGGVISSYVEYLRSSKATSRYQEPKVSEYIGKDEKTAFRLIEEKIRKNTKAVLDESDRLKCPQRDCAMKIAKERTREKCNICK
jgi:glutamate dehydrogenase (NAD(P)+)